MKNNRNKKVSVNAMFKKESLIIFVVALVISIVIYIEVNRKEKVVAVEYRKTYYTECLKKDGFGNCVVKNIGYKSTQGIKDALKNSWKSVRKKLKKERDDEKDK